MSCFVTRPRCPVPGTREISTPASSAIRRTTGVERVRSRSSLVVVHSDSGASASAASTGGAGVGAGVATSPDAEARTRSDALDWTGAAAAVGAGVGPESPLPAAAPSGSMNATMVPTSTVSPSATRTSARTPPAGDGISASTLSVEISRIGSSRSTGSPGRFSHLDTVPSAMDSPIWGIGTSMRDTNPAPVGSVRPSVLCGGSRIGVSTLQGNGSRPPHRPARAGSSPPGDRRRARASLWR